ncbi:serine/threonine protein kinase [Sandaracinus amylolyticus]|uniref:serine/threonine protein kinase n=1 Tax=Sandaracinus amylolyticus TaxID=927083 RepID=UPI001F320E24|nr:serine/threonine-protein kinase [Sandaracinus amylolyticus]UJR83113.1 Hypothetical protein I5071_51790 [Sandaracinus amylolyticus]
MLHALPALSSGASARVGKYRVLGKLGEGGMAEVFLATADHTPGFHKLLVLKLLRESLAEDPHAVTMFLDEARLAARLNHRNVVQTYEVGRAGTRYAIVMEYLEGASWGRLRRLAERDERKLPLAAGLHVLSEALTGLHYAHELPDYDGSSLDLVHRDFTPNNVFLTLDGQVKVLDFGIAKTRANVSETRTGVFKGTVRYMAPEALLAEKVDRRADIYMAGAMLWEVLAGQRMWAGKEDAAIMHSTIAGSVPPPTRFDQKVPRALEAVALKALEKEPDQRYASALAMRDALRRAMDESGIAYGTDQLAAVVDEHAGESCRGLREQVARELASGDIALGDRTSPSVASLEAPAPTTIGTGTGSITPPPSSPSRAPRAMGAVAIGVVAALAVWAVMASREPDPAPAAVLPVAQSVPSAPGAMPARITVRIAAEPLDARIEIDGRTVEGNPVELQTERDEATHVVRARAPGHEPQTIEVRFDRDVHAALTLTRTPVRSASSRPAASSRRRAASAPAPAPVATTAAPEPAPAPARPAAPPEPAADDHDFDRTLARRARAPRPIDTEDPFAD